MLKTSLDNPSDNGIPFGLEDEELRKLANKPGKSKIKFKDTTKMNHYVPPRGDSFAKVKRPTRGYQAMSDDVAAKTLLNFITTEGKNLYMHFRPDCPKTGETASAIRYRNYKHIKTFEEYIDQVIVHATWCCRLFKQIP